MSKYVKNLIADDLRGRLEGVDDALLVDVIGIDASEACMISAKTGLGVDDDDAIGPTFFVKI